MLQSEQLETPPDSRCRHQVAAGLRPAPAAGGPATRGVPTRSAYARGLQTASPIWPRRSSARASCSLDTPTILRRLFWEDPPVRRPQTLRFGCHRSRERSACSSAWAARRWTRLIAERGEIEVGCDFCGIKYTFDSIDASALFVPAADHPSASGIDAEGRCRRRGRSARRTPGRLERTVFRPIRAAGNRRPASGPGMESALSRDSSPGSGRQCGRHLNCKGTPVFPEGLRDVSLTTRRFLKTGAAPPSR